MWTENASWEAILEHQEPTSIIVSVSGGVDSDATALWARARWPKQELILLHWHLAAMDWPQTSAHLDALAAHLAPARRVTLQPVYERTGARTPTGAHAVRLRRLHDVGLHGEATDADPAAITTLWDLVAARLNMPPTAKTRYCTSYFKIAPTDAWLRADREVLGARPLLLTGERWAESPGRSRLPWYQWRVPLQPCPTWPGGHRVLWLRPVLDRTLAQVTATVLDAGRALHPGYAIQGRAPAALRDAAERGRPRLSCRCCIFSAPQHIQAALQNDPASMQDAVDAVRHYEAESGYSWQQRGFLDDLLQSTAETEPTTTESEQPWQQLGFDDSLLT